MTLGFFEHARCGVPITVLSLAVGAGLAHSRLARSVEILPPSGMRSRGLGQRRFTHSHWSGAAAIQRANRGLTRAVMSSADGLGLESGLGLHRAMDRDHEAAPLAALDARRDQRHVQPQGQPRRHQGGGGGHAEEWHLLAAIEALVRSAGPTLRPCCSSRSMARDASPTSRKLQPSGRAPAVHQLLDRGVGLPAIDHAERDARAHRRDRQEIPVGEVRRHEDPGRPLSRTWRVPPRSTSSARFAPPYRSRTATAGRAGPLNRSVGG